MGQSIKLFTNSRQLKRLYNREMFAYFDKNIYIKIQKNHCNIIFILFLQFIALFLILFNRNEKKWTHEIFFKGFAAVRKIRLNFHKAQMSLDDELDPSLSALAIA